MADPRTPEQRIAEQIEIIRRGLQYPANGVHYCRGCNAGTSNGWQHSEGCSIVYNERLVNKAHKELEAIAAALRSASAPQGEMRRAFDYVALEPGQEAKCLVCGLIKPWGILDGQTGVTVCIECRDAARKSQVVQQGWQPIETAEKDARAIVTDGRYVEVGYLWQHRRAVWTYDADGTKLRPQPTHWMPLPDPPAAAPKEEVHG